MPALLIKSYYYAISMCNYDLYGLNVNAWIEYPMLHLSPKPDKIHILNKIRSRLINNPLISLLSQSAQDLNGIVSKKF